MIIQEYKKLTYKNKVVFDKIIVHDFEREPKKFINDEACFMFLVDCNFQVRTPDEVITFKKGDGMLSKCSNYFFEKNHPDKKIKMTAIGIYCHKSILNEIFDKGFNLSTFKTNYCAKKVVVNKLLLNVRDSIDSLLDNPELADEQMITTKLKEFLILLSKSENAPSVFDLVSSLFKSYEYNFKKAVENNLYANLSLEELAFLCNMSLATFKRKFKEIYNESPRKYITKKKIEKACGQLELTEKRISDIIFDCGFETISTFNRVFKSYLKKSPSAYRLSLTA